MVTLIIHWESGWLDSKTENFIWKQLRHAYNVDRLMFVGEPDTDRVGVEWFKTVQEAISLSKGKLFILNPAAANTGFTAAEDSVFLFGNAVISNSNIIGEHVRIDTPSTTDMFAFNAAAIVLDRIACERR